MAPGKRCRCFQARPSRDAGPMSGARARPPGASRKILNGDQDFPDRPAESSPAQHKLSQVITSAGSVHRSRLVVMRFAAVD